MEILTGPAAGQVGLIIKYSDDGTLTFDPADGLHPDVAIATGDRYRIVEQNPTRTVELEILDDVGPRDDDGEATTIHSR